MMDALLALAGHPSTPWIIIVGAAAITIVAAFRDAPAAMLGDVFDDDFV
ncbi:MAG: hypothetical protein AAFX03_12110 [Pseudomonadota bacterium]